MATAIRMRRGGRTHAPYYRIVVIDSRHRDRGPEVEVLGYHHPCARPKPTTEINVHKALDWLRKGALPSDTARSVLSKLGVLKHFNDGTTPDEPVAVLQGEDFTKKGYNAPPPPREEAPAAPEPVAQSAPEAAEAPAEAPAEAQS